MLSIPGLNALTGSALRYAFTAGSSASDPACLSSCVLSQGLFSSRVDAGGQTTSVMEYENDMSAYPGMPVWLAASVNTGLTFSSLDAAEHRGGYERDRSRSPRGERHDGYERDRSRSPRGERHDEPTRVRSASPGGRGSQ